MRWETIVISSDDTHTVGGWSSSSTNGWKLGLGGGTATLRPDLDLRGNWNQKQTQSMIYQITASILLQLPPDTKLNTKTLKTLKLVRWLVKRVILAHSSSTPTRTFTLLHFSGFCSFSLALAVGGAVQISNLGSCGSVSALFSSNITRRLFCLGPNGCLNWSPRASVCQSERVWLNWSVYTANIHNTFEESFYSHPADAFTLLMGTTAFFFPLALSSASDDRWGSAGPSSSSSSSLCWSVMDDIICLQTRACKALEINTFHYETIWTLNTEVQWQQFKVHIHNFHNVIFLIQTI